MVPHVAEGRYEHDPIQNLLIYLKYYENFKILFIFILFCNLVTQLSSVKFADDDFVWPCQQVGHKK